MAEASEAKAMEQLPPDLRQIVQAAKKNPYECFASAAVALAFHKEKSKVALATLNPNEEGQ